MKKTSIYTLLLILAGFVFVSCSDDDEFNPFKDYTVGELNPGTITFRKDLGDIQVVEEWSGITRNDKKQVTAYNYTRNTKGLITENEIKNCTLNYITTHKGKQEIRTNSNVTFSKVDNSGIRENYTETIDEVISINAQGYIDAINTTITHFDSATPNSPITSTSERTFSYNGDFCTSSSYDDGRNKTTYTYSWGSYMLNRITIHNVDTLNNTIEYEIYDYTFDTDKLCQYSGAEILPYIQSGFPQIYASMGYLGKFTPYVLTGEVQSGHTEYPNMPSAKPQINNTYNFEQYSDGTGSLNFVCSGISNKYSTYSVTFSK